MIKNGKRITIVFDREQHDQLRKIQGKIINQTGRNLSFSGVVRFYLQQGLKEKNLEKLISEVESDKKDD